MDFEKRSTYTFQFLIRHQQLTASPALTDYGYGSSKEKRDRLTFSYYENYTTHIQLTVRMEDEQAKVDNYEKIKAATWMDILKGKVPEELKDFDDPKWDERPPDRVPKMKLYPGWEKLVTPSGRTYYADNNTRTTHWTLP
jgi:hypothetical protein